MSICSECGGSPDDDAGPHEAGCKMSSITVPTIHLNGTSRDELLRQLMVAVAMLRLAIEAVSQAAPNGRDYYPQGQDAIRKAVEQHRARLGALNNVSDELQYIAERISA